MLHLRLDILHEDEISEGTFFLFYHISLVDDKCESRAIEEYEVENNERDKSHHNSHDTHDEIRSVEEEILENVGKLGREIHMMILFDELSEEDDAFEDSTDRPAGHERELFFTVIA
jgi:hypothetical protein